MAKKTKEFWADVIAQANAAKAAGGKVREVLEKYGVSEGAYYSARNHYGYSKSRSGGSGKFVEFAPTNSAPITVRLGDLEVSVSSSEQLRTVLAVLAEGNR